MNNDKELEEEIKHYIQKKYPDGIGFPNVPKIARHFAEWQKQKDLEDAVDAFVNTYENTDDSNYVEFVTEQSPYKFKETEKCKLIIIKEKQQ